jgi:phosphoserine phosphatase
VRERTLAAWCLDRMRAGPVARRLAAGLAALQAGPPALLLDLAGREAGAARAGMRVLAGVEASALEAWARARLTPNPRAHQALARLAREAGSLRLLVVSRGTPGLAVRAYLARPDVAPHLAPAPEVLAPEAEVIEGRLTGRLLSLPLPKRERIRLLAPGTVFLGDRRDARWASRGRSFRFERV